MTQDNKRCVITGLGMINAIGNNVNESFENAKKSVSGIDNTHTVDTVDCYATLSAEVKNFDHNDPKIKDLDKVSRYAVTAAHEAVADAKLGAEDFTTRTSVIMGSCVGGADSIEHYYKNNKDTNDILKMPIGRIANDVANEFGAKGVVTNVANACAAGTISIAYACDLIRSGKADVVIAGGADVFSSVPYSGFLALHALDANPCSPFNHCTGITLGEGAGVVIVESYEHAKKRNAHMYCEVLGSGVSSDAHHITAPRPDGEGQMNAINWAIKTSGVSKKEIGYINAHGTGTSKNDSAEFLSLHTIFDDENDDLSVSSTKAMVGHCLGAAGAIEAVFSIKCLTENVVLPTLRYSEEDLITLAEKAGKIDFIPNKAHDKKLETVMSNSFAFGGNNASIIFSKNSGNVTYDYKNESIAVTGFGLVTPLGNGVEKFVENLNAQNKVTLETVKSAVGSDDYNELGLKMAFYRKLDNFSQLQAVSGMAALKDAGFTVTDENATSIGIVVGSSEGALGTCLNFEDNICQKGNANGSAFNFPNTVYNAAGGYLSICSGIKGYNVTITNGAQSGLQSVAYAANVLRSGVEDYILATGTDENIPVISEAYTKLGLVSDKVNTAFEGKKEFTLTDGSASVLLARKGAKADKVYAYVKGFGMAHEPNKFGTYTNSDNGLKVAIEEALKDANLTAMDIDLVSGFACGMKDIDDVELNVYSEIFGNVNAVEIKDYFGEGRSASATFAFALGSLILSGDVKSLGGYEIASKKATKKEFKDFKNVKNVLVTSYSTGGSYTAVVVSKEA
ncbi:MAG: beta-ketoacyl-[Acholeplasmatales bacterium]|nr:beta-ketoacyl-[acyl-carrier-protein] synthase family protein [Acholeplasmatales bacterium]